MAAATAAAASAVVHVAAATAAVASAVVHVAAAVIAAASAADHAEVAAIAAAVDTATVADVDKSEHQFPDLCIRHL